MQGGKILLTLLAFVAGLSLLTAQTSGMASYYNDGLHGRRTASGERYNKADLTCASRDYPFGSVLRVTRIDNNQSVEVRVNDCGPHRPDRVIDLSRAAAERIGLIRDGLANVRIEVVMPGNGRMPCGGKAPVATPTPAPANVPTAYDQTGKAPVAIPADTTVAPPPPPMMPTEGTVPAAALKPITTGFGVQVGSFGYFENAQRMSNDLQSRGFQDVLISSRGNMFRVVLGPFPSHDRADAYRVSLRRNHNLNGVVIDLSESR